MSGTIAQPAQAGHAQLPSRLLVSTPRHDPEGFTTLRGSKVFAIMQGDARSRHGVSTEPQPEHLAKVTGGGASMRPGGQVKRSSRDIIAASRDRGRGSARTPHPHAGRPAALHAVL